MTTPFPSSVEVPSGLVTRRMHFGLPMAFVAGFGIALAAVFFALGWHDGLMFLPVALGLGLYLATECRHDPDVVQTWQGEMRLPEVFDA